MASGDIALTTPRSAPNLNFRAFHYYPAIGSTAARAEVTFVDDLGTVFTVYVQNGICQGFNASTGAPVNLTLASELTNLRTQVFAANALTNGVALLRTDGLIVAPGTVG